MRLDTSRATLILRVLQAIFAIVVLGLTGYVAHWWSSYWHTSSPPQISFLLFTAIWTLLALTYLLIIPHRFSNTLLADPKLVLAVEAVTMLFWFAGFVALAVFLADRVCFGRVCAAAKAAAVFGGFAWLTFAITTALAVMAIFRGGARSSSPRTGGAARPKNAANKSAGSNVNIHEGA